MFKARFPKFKLSNFRLPRKLRDLSISVKIIALVLVSVAVPLIITTALALGKLSDIYDENIRTGLSVAMNSVNKDIEARTKAMKNEAILISSSEQIKTAISKNDELSLNQYIIRTSGDMGLKSIIIGDKNGKTITRSDKPSALGEDISSLKSYKASIIGNVDSVLEEFGNGIGITSYSPIKQKIDGKENIVGVVILVRQITAKDLEVFASTTIKISLATTKGIIIGEKPKTDKVNYLLSSKPLVSRLGVKIGEIIGVQDIREFALAKKSLILNTLLLNSFIALPVLIIGLMLTWSISVPLKKLKLNMIESSKGDLSLKTNLRNKDEIGLVSYAFDHMIGNLAKLILLIRENIGKAENTFAKAISRNKILTESIKEVEIISYKIEECSNEQQRKLAAALGSVNMNTEGIVKITKEADFISSLSVKTTELVDKSNQNIEKQIVNLGVLLTGFERTSNDLYRFSSELVKIMDLVELVKEFALNTKLLAFNATIEAARAGKAGNGFGVVAREITRLALEVGESISSVEKNVTNLVSDMDNDKKSISDSVKSLKQLATEMNLSISDMGEAKREVQIVRDRSMEIAKIVHGQVGNSKITQESIDSAHKQLNEFIEFSITLREATEKTSLGIEYLSISLHELFGRINDAGEATGKFKV